MNDDRNMNALEQALQDHLNKDKIDNRAENYEKYLLRIKNIKTVNQNKGIN